MYLHTLLCFLYAYNTFRQTLNKGTPPFADVATI
jgi:hypothetical protein